MISETNYSYLIVCNQAAGDAEMLLGLQHIAIYSYLLWKCIIYMQSVLKILLVNDAAVSNRPTLPIFGWLITTYTCSTYLITINLLLQFFNANKSTNVGNIIFNNEHGILIIFNKYEYEGFVRVLYCIFYDC